MLIVNRNASGSGARQDEPRNPLSTKARILRWFSPDKNLVPSISKEQIRQRQGWDNPVQSAES